MSLIQSFKIGDLVVSNHFSEIGYGIVMSKPYIRREDYQLISYDVFWCRRGLMQVYKENIKKI